MGDKIICDECGKFYRPWSKLKKPICKTCYEKNKHITEIEKESLRLQRKAAGVEDWDNDEGRPCLKACW